MTTAAELRKQLAEAEERERQEKERMRNAVKPAWEYHVQINAPNNWDKVFSPDHIMVRVWKRLTNRKDVESVGGFTDYDGSGMNYVYHVPTAKIVCHCGGGLILVNDQQTADRLGEFLRNNPNGGICTECFR